MKKILLIFCFLVFMFSCAQAYNVNNYTLSVEDEIYTCSGNNCYNLSSIHRNKKTKTSTVDMIVDLMNWDLHEEYLSPYNDGYISHIIFEVKLHKDKINIKCKDFVVGTIVVNYKNNRPSFAYSDVVAIHRKRPSTINNIKELEKTFYTWIDVDSVKKLLKNE